MVFLEVFADLRLEDHADLQTISRAVLGDDSGSQGRKEKSYKVTVSPGLGLTVSGAVDEWGSLE